MYESSRQNSAGQATRGGRATGSAQQSGQDNERMQQQGRSDRGQSADGGRDERVQHAADHSMRLTELAIRGTTMLFDIQIAALRSVWQMQARTATVLGAPDTSDLLRIADDGVQQIWSSGTEQLLASARQATDAIAEIQRQFGQIVEQGTARLSEEMRSGIEDLNQRTQSSMRGIQDLARESAEEGRQMLREGEQFARSAGEAGGGRGGAQGSAGQEAEGPGANAAEEAAASGSRDRNQGQNASSAQSAHGETERNSGRGGKRH